MSSMPANEAGSAIRGMMSTVSAGYVLRRLAALHDLPHIVLAEYIGSSKQTIGPILTGKKSVGRDLLERLSGAFGVPTSVVSEGNVTLALAIGLLMIEQAPVATFSPLQKAAITAQYREDRIRESQGAHEAMRQFHADNPEVVREAEAIVDSVRGRQKWWADVSSSDKRVPR